MSVYARPYDKDYPVICMDEKPVQLFANARKSFRSKNGRIEYEDNEYIRNGTACIFMFTEPLNGWRFAGASSLPHEPVCRTPEQPARAVSMSSSGISSYEYHLLLHDLVDPVADVVHDSDPRHLVAAFEIFGDAFLLGKLF